MLAQKHAFFPPKIFSQFYHSKHSKNIQKEHFKNLIEMLATNS